MPLSNKEIYSLLYKDDIKGLEQLFDRYYRPLTLWSDTFLKDIAQAEDLVQDFFIKFWEKKLFLTITPEKLNGYLYSSIKNQSLNRLERIDPIRFATDIAFLDLSYEELDNVQEKQLIFIEQEIDKLPQRSKQIMQGIYLQGKKYKEVAEENNISISTVKTLLSNSMKKIRENKAKIKEILIFFFTKKL